MTEDKHANSKPTPAPAVPLAPGAPGVPGEPGSAPGAPVVPADSAVAPVSAICEGASANAAAQIDDDSEIQPVEGFFLTSQRWH